MTECDKCANYKNIGIPDLVYADSGCVKMEQIAKKYWNEAMPKLYIYGRATIEVKHPCPYFEAKQ